MIYKNLSAEARRMTKLLKGRIVKICSRHRAGEVLVEFECGTRLFVDAEGEVEVSITAGRENGSVEERRPATKKTKKKGGRAE